MDVLIGRYDIPVVVVVFFLYLLTTNDIMLSTFIISPLSLSKPDFHSNLGLSLLKTLVQ